MVVELFKIIKLFHKRDASIPHRNQIKQNKENKKSYKTKHQDQFYKYEKPKPNKYPKKYIHKNGSKINQY